MAWLSPISSRDIAGGPAGRGARWEAGWEQARLLAGSRVFAGLLAALLAADGLLILLHILSDLHEMRVVGDAGSLLSDWRFRIEEELGYGEMFGYLKSVAIAIALFVCYRRARAPAFAALSFTFALIALDDSLRIHEFFGSLIEKGLSLQPAFGLRPQDLGELMVWSALGTAVAAALAAGFMRSGREARSLASLFLCLFGVLVFFAVGADMLQIAFHNAFRGAQRLWTVVEEGGEMATLSLICAAAITAASVDRAAARSRAR